MMNTKKFLACLGLICLSVIIALTAVGCTDNEEEKPPVTETVTIELSYDAESGILSWTAVENAAKYTVNVIKSGETPVTKEVTENKIALELKNGSTRVTVTAFDSGSAELGVGSKIITLEVDFGAPVKPANLKYDKTNGKLTWDASEGADKYLVNVTSITDAEFVILNAEVTETEKQLDLSGGIYEISVYAVSAGGAKGETSVIEYRSFTDGNFGAEIGETGFYRILDFEDENVLEISRQSDYIEWASGVLGSCVYGISQEIVINASIDEDGDGEPDRNENGNIVYEREPSESKILELEQIVRESGTSFAGATFNLQEKITDFGRLYFDVYRATGSSVSVMLDDGEGHSATIPVEWNHNASWYNWSTVSLTKSAIMNKAPEFTGIKEITFYFRNANGGRVYFDNVRFDKTDLGDLGGITYSKKDTKFVWDAVESAARYELYIDGAEEPSVSETAELVLTEPLAAGNHSVKLVAINGEYKREKTVEFFVDKDARFDVPVEEGSDEFILAAFDTNEYLPYLKPNGGYAPKYTVNDGVVEATFTHSWVNGALNYEFPQTIDGKTIYKLNIRFKVAAGVTFVWYGADSDGNECYFSANHSDSPIMAEFMTVTDEEDGWKRATVDMTKLVEYSTNNWTNSVCNSLKTIKFAVNKIESPVYIGAVTYERFPDSMSAELSYDGKALPEHTFTDVTYDLSKLGTGIKLAGGQLTATLKKGDGEATALDLTQTSYKFEEGAYTFNVALGNSVVTVSASKTFTVHKRGYNKYSDDYTVLGDFDGDYYENSFTSAGGSTFEFLSYDENDGILNGCTDGALKLACGTEKNWNGRVTYALNKTVNTDDFDSLLIRFYKTNTTAETAKCNYSVYLFFGDDSVNAFGITAYDYEPHKLKWSTAQITSAMLKAKGITSFDKINFTASEAYGIVYIDELGLTKNSGFGKPTGAGGSEYMLADFSGKTAVTFSNHKDVDIFDVSDYLYVTTTMNEYKQTWANARIDFTLSAPVDLTAISSVTVRGKNLKDNFLIYFINSDGKDIYAAQYQTKYCSFVEDGEWQELTVDFTKLDGNQTNWTYDDGIPQGSLTKYAISAKARNQAFVIDKITYTLRA